MLRCENSGGEKGTPPKDFVSITVKKEVYEHLRKQYKKKKNDWLLKHGITSFSGYVTYQLNELVEAQMKEESERLHPST
jgi:hypothetical protein